MGSKLQGLPTSPNLCPQDIRREGTSQMNYVRLAFVQQGANSTNYNLFENTNNITPIYD